ncbi:hypothetical protein [Micromonospora sp. WMMD1082]|uniref:hypothetical protein n=1 Tax=Micromonospora sp. WMMD1082 TaxID=3016104 RepID=UPI0024175DA5|nr:hypothetical protein [Micromonospora sp. WMMD1082]MDG4795276.1 hypothetical protein [Micromonospora sp. WMMD1082]
MSRYLRARATVTALFTATVSLVAPAPAGAAPLGSVRLPVTSGIVDATPIFASATTSAPCPAGFGRNAQLRVGPPGGPFSNLARPLTDGGYDRAPVTARPNRSFVTALGGAPVDGEWWVVVECLSETQGVHPERFVTPITVSGRQWRSGRPAGAAPATPGPDGAVVVPDGGGTRTPAPGTASGMPAATPSTATTAIAEDAEQQRRLTGNGGSGAASLANLWWILALLAALTVVGATSLLLRRPDPSQPGRQGRRR